MKIKQSAFLACVLILIAGCKGGGGGDRWKDGCTEYRCGGGDGVSRNGGSRQTLNSQQIAAVYGIRAETVELFFDIYSGVNVAGHLALLGVTEYEAFLVATGQLQDAKIIERVAHNINESPTALQLLYDDYTQNLE